MVLRCDFSSMIIATMIELRSIPKSCVSDGGAAPWGGAEASGAGCSGICGGPESTSIGASDRTF